MLRTRGLEIVDTISYTHETFRLILRLWRRYTYMPRALIWALPLADRLFPPRPSNRLDSPCATLERFDYTASRL
jgi:hypothetical protein